MIIECPLKPFIHLLPIQITILQYGLKYYLEYLGFQLVFPSTCRIPLKNLAAQGAKAFDNCFPSTSKSNITFFKRI